MRRPKKANGPRGNASSDKSASVKLPSLKSTELSGRQRVRRHHNDHEFLQLKHALEKQEKENAKLKAENDQLKANALNFHEKLHKVHDEERHLEEELLLEGSLFAQQTKEDEKKFKSMARKILEKEMDLRRLKIEFSKVKDDLRGVNSQLVTAQEDLKQTIQEANNLKELSKTLALKISRLQYRDPKEFSGERLAARRYARAGEASSGARPKAKGIGVDGKFKSESFDVKPSLRSLVDKDNEETVKLPPLIRTNRRSPTVMLNDIVLPGTPRNLLSSKSRPNSTSSESQYSSSSSERSSPSPLAESAHGYPSDPRERRVSVV